MQLIKSRTGGKFTDIPRASVEFWLHRLQLNTGLQEPFALGVTLTPPQVRLHPVAARWLVGTFLPDPAVRVNCVVTPVMSNVVCPSVQCPTL
jgi:hypothetical protein